MPVLDTRTHTLSLCRLLDGTPAALEKDFRMSVSNEDVGTPPFLPFVLANLRGLPRHPDDPDWNFRNVYRFLGDPFSFLPPDIRLAAPKQENASGLG